MLGEGPTFGINESFESLVKQTQTFSWVYITTLIIVISLLMEKNL